VDQVTNGKYEVLRKTTATPPFSLEATTMHLLHDRAGDHQHREGLLGQRLMDGDVEGTWNDYLTQLSNAGLSDMLAVLTADTRPTRRFTSSMLPSLRRTGKAAWKR
jgi:hypothetical protein